VIAIVVEFLDRFMVVIFSVIEMSIFALSVIFLAFQLIAKTITPKKPQF